MRIRTALMFVVWLIVPALQATELPIGAIQGAGGESPYLNRFVSFRGVVVGRYEDRNTRGDVYYTLFVQDAPGAADGDPATSDGIAVFLGREPRRDIALGDRVRVGGKVTEFFGLTEIDDRGLTVTVEGNGPLPTAVSLDPPAEVDAAATYFEALEGMRVAYGDSVVVAGPTHEGCGFAVIAEVHVAGLPVLRRADDDPTGQVVPVLYPSDLDCGDIPQVKTGDRLTGMAGALTYNFDQFKIVFDSADQLSIEPAASPSPPTLPALVPEQIAVASINAEDYFDTARDTNEEGEPVLTAMELSARRGKYVTLIAEVLRCPTVIGFQEIEHEALLLDLSSALEAPCGFAYQVTHRESPDARGIDNALFSDSRRVSVGEVVLRQTCSPVPTEVRDASAGCPAGEQPLFGRPPLQVEATIDGLPYTFWINHFKSKRGGETETGLERIQQAVYLNALAAERLMADPRARLIALGDFNDTDLSPALALLTDAAQGGRYHNALLAVPAASRYTYNFGGVSELIDTILVSPALVGEIGLATIVHTNTDYPSGWRLDATDARRPFRASDHDVPLLILGQWPATPTPAPTPTPRPTVVSIPSPSAPAATADISPSSGVRATLVATNEPATAAAPAATPAPAASDSSGRGLALGLIAAGLLIAGLVLIPRIVRR